MGGFPDLRSHPRASVPPVEGSGVQLAWGSPRCSDCDCPLGDWYSIPSTQTPWKISALGLQENHGSVEPVIRFSSFSAINSAELSQFVLSLNSRKDGRIMKYLYPVFPPDKNIDDVLSWLRDNGT